MHDATFLFTDIEGSTRLWEQQPERMRPALAAHDAMVREAIERHSGRVVKMTGDGVHAVFEDALDAVVATVAIQQAMPRLAADIELRLRCGLHAGPSEGRDGDYYGAVVNRAARIMSAAHGGQVLLSDAVAQRLDGRVPDGISFLDLGSVRLRDLARAERIYQLVHPALRESFPALRSLEDTPNNLPLQLSSFVGRHREIGHVRALAAANRLVTVVGLGGLGKTRLALQAAAEALGDHADGVWLVELAPLQDARGVAQSVATVLGVKEESGHAIEDALARHVRDRQILLLLDNCEHVAEGAAPLVRRLLEAGPQVHALATSREPLRLPGEAVYPLAGLAVPGPREAMSADAVIQYESVRLFVERARVASPAFVFDDNTASTIAAMCHRLDGIPLALELAAARVRGVPLAQIATRLKDRFRLLTSADPTATPRQRTLRATIDWSHELLPDDERMLFRRLSVFAGGCSLEAAEAVCSGNGLDRDAVLDLLSRLVEKSLATLTRDGERYEMLETVREYARQRLEECGEAEPTLDAHFAYFAKLATDARAAIVQGQGGPWLAKLDTDRDNILAAHAWGMKSPPLAGGALQLADNLKFYWAHRGLLALGHRLTSEALTLPANGPPSSLRASGLFNAGQYAYFMGRYAEARGDLERSIEMARGLGEPGTLMRALQTLGMVAIGQDDLSTARTALREAIDLAKAASETRVLAGAMVALAMLLRVEHDFAASEPLYREVVRLARASGDREAESVGQLNLSMLRAEAGDFDSAFAAAGEALAIAREIGTVQAIHSTLEVCAGLAAWQGDDRKAAVLYGAAEAIAMRTGVKRDAADEAFLAPRIERTRAVLGTEVFEAAARSGAALPPEEAADYASAWLESARVPQRA